MKRSVKIFASITIIIVLISTITIIGYTVLNSKTTKQVHVGVTYGGDTVEDAKLLIDKVKGYTNLFVIASGILQYNYNETLEYVCDYAVNAGLDIIVYSGSYETQASTTESFIASAKEKWGSHFLGVYFGDEPGGKMLDGDRETRVDLGDVPNVGNVTKYSDRLLVSQTNGSVEVSKEFRISGGIGISQTERKASPIGSPFNSVIFSSNYTSYDLDGTIRFSNFADPQNPEFLVYLPNGTVTLQKGYSNPSVPVTDKGSISQFTPYQEIWDSRPFQTINDSATVATAYVNAMQTAASKIRNQSDLKLFTSDYALHWYDYKGGYDTIFAQLGWNNTVAQEIGLVRGAANLQGKNWGTIITWKYMQAPYLTDGNEMFEQMKTSYETGAEYVIVFNYAEDMSGPYGTLKEEHFQALERFWKDVVKNPSVTHVGVKAEAVLVLPKDYG